MAVVVRTMLFLAVDLLLAWQLLRRLPRARFRTLGLAVPAVAGALWAVFGTFLIWVFWDDYYSSFYGDWVRWSGPLIALIYFVVGLALWWLALRLPGQPSLSFLLLGGCESILEHLLGIYAFRILELPVLAGIGAAELLIFAFFEYVLYWGIILAVAALATRGRRRAPLQPRAFQ